jgi:hypothetical protein
MVEAAREGSEPDIRPEDARPSRKAVFAAIASARPYTLEGGDLILLARDIIDPGDDLKEPTYRVIGSMSDEASAREMVRQMNEQGRRRVFLSRVTVEDISSEGQAPQAEQTA